MPPPTRGPPFAAFAASSLRALASSACFFLYSLSAWMSEGDEISEVVPRLPPSFPSSPF